MNHDLARVEALIYVTGDAGITSLQISQTLQIDLAAVEQLLRKLTLKYQTDINSGLQIINYGQRYQMTTKPALNADIKSLYADRESHAMTQASLESLTIIAYQQPVTRVEVDAIRGVNSSAIIQKLLKQGLIRAAGQRAEVGNPIQYQTTELFLNWFGLKSLAELPPLDLDTDEKGEN